MIPLLTPGYLSDFCHAFVAGTPSPEVKTHGSDPKRYTGITKLLLATELVISAGLFRITLKRNGLRRCTRIHWLVLDRRCEKPDVPHWRSWSRHPSKAGMTITIEPMVILVTGVLAKLPMTVGLFTLMAS